MILFRVSYSIFSLLPYSAAQQPVQCRFCLLYTSGLLKGNGSVVAQAVEGTDYATPVVDITATLSTTWAGSETPYTQVVTMADMTADAKIEVGLASTVTAEQYAAAAAAQLMGTSQAAGNITMTAYGEKPTIEILILVRAVG